MMAKAETCPKCGKPFKNLKLHMRNTPNCELRIYTPPADALAGYAAASPIFEVNPLGRTQNTQNTQKSPSGPISEDFEDSVYASPSHGDVPPRSTASPPPALGALGISPELLQQLAEQYVAPIAVAAAKQTVESAAKDILAQLPNLVTQMVNQRLEQRAAAAQDRGAADPQPSPAADRQPNSNRTAMLESLLPVLAKAMAGGGSDPSDALVKQIEAMGRVIGAVDQIRGNSGGAGGMTPNTALRWAQWGHQLGAAGAPQPNFDTQSTHIPPSPQTGPPER